MAGPKFKDGDGALLFSLSMIILIFMCILPVSLAIVWFLCFLSYAGITSWPDGMSAAKFLSITAMALSGISASLGVGGATGILEVDKKVQVLIWTSFLGGVMLAVLQWMKALPQAQ
jgi:hypothetical protein